MKLLLDQNISRKLILDLDKIFSGTAHISNFNLEKETDKKIREFAFENNFTIVTQDADFFEKMLLKGFPPKIVWLKCGNTSTKNILKIIIENQKAIEHLHNDKTLGCLELE